jgi:DNA-3-methyladenine glycosylase
MNRPSKTGSACRLRRLRRAALPIDTLELARYLIGKALVRDTASRLSGRIVETVACPIGDASGRAFRGKTPHNRSLFLERGHVHVYFIHGSSYLMNVSSEVPEVGAGVLLRAVEPLEGVELMVSSSGKTRFTDLGRGPGRLTKAMQTDLRQDGLDLSRPRPALVGGNRAKDWHDRQKRVSVSAAT